MGVGWTLLREFTDRTPQLFLSEVKLSRVFGVGTQSLGILGTENMVPHYGCVFPKFVRFGNRLHRAKLGFFFCRSPNFGVAPPYQKRRENRYLCRISFHD